LLLSDRLTFRLPNLSPKPAISYTIEFELYQLTIKTPVYQSGVSGVLNLVELNCNMHV